MSDLGVQPAAEVTPGLSQWQRVTNTFTAPSKTFDDIKRGHKSWWLPFLLSALASYLLFAAVYSKVGMQTVVDNQIRMDPKAEERLAQVPPEQQALQKKISLYITETIFVINPAFLLGMLALGSLVMMGTINFGFGGKAKFGSIFSVWMFAGLPGIIKVLLGVIVLFAGAAPESFNIRNFAPTNLGAFLSPTETNRALYTLASSFDLVTIWTMVLLGMGIAAVAGVKRSSGYTAVFGWWALIVIVQTGWAAAFS